MAYIRKSRDKWRAEIERHGIRTSKTFATKSAAIQWAAAEEAAILSVKDGGFPRKTLADALTRFSKKVDVLTLAKISGHRDLSILQNHYYRVTSEDIAKRLD